MTTNTNKDRTNGPCTGGAYAENVSRLSGLCLAILAAVVALLAALAPGAGAASAIDGFQIAKFKVEIEGSSNTIWRSILEPETECDSGDHSFGRERFTFATKKPFIITATYFPDELNPDVFSGRSTLGAPVVAHIKRSYTPDVVPPARTCEDNGGGAEPVKPDCGARTRNWHVELEFSDKRRNGLQLHGDTAAAVPYEHCPAALWCYPFLLDVKNMRTQEPLFADLSPDDLFNPKLRKWITIGDGDFKDGDEDVQSETHVHWTASFTRLKG
jgi:hypothetical protein